MCPYPLLTLGSCSIGVIAVPTLQLSESQEQRSEPVCRVGQPENSFSAPGRLRVFPLVPPGFQNSPSMRRGHQPSTLLTLPLSSR